MNTQKLTNEQIIAMHVNDGMTIVQICDITERKYNNVYHILRSTGNFNYKNFPSPLRKSTVLSKLNMWDAPPPFSGHAEAIIGKNQQDKIKTMNMLHDLHSKAKYTLNASKEVLEGIIKVLEPLEREFLPYSIL